MVNYYNFYSSTTMEVGGQGACVISTITDFNAKGDVTLTVQVKSRACL